MFTIKRQNKNVIIFVSWIKKSELTAAQAQCQNNKQSLERNSRGQQHIPNGTKFRSELKTATLYSF